MKIVGIFDNCGVGLDVQPSLKQVVIEENDKFGIMYENANNDEVRLDFNLRSASGEQEIEKCIHAYLFGEESIADRFLDLKNLPEELKDNHDRYAPVFYDKYYLSKQPTFTRIDDERFIIEEGLEISGDTIALGLITEGGKIFIGSPEYLLGVIKTLYSDTKNKDILSIKANLFEDINELEEAKRMIQNILEIQSLDYHQVEMYEREVKSLNNKIRGREILSVKYKDTRKM